MENIINLEDDLLKTPSKGRNMIAVASGRGGVGKTWFSVSLSHALSLFRQKTLLFDADMGMENVSTQLGLDMTYDLGHAIKGEKSLNQIIYNYDKCKFDILAARSGTAGLASLPVGRLHLLGEDLCFVAADYDKIILDMGVGISKSVKVLSGIADNVLVLCTDDPSSLTEAYAYIKVMTSQYPKCSIQMVINQANTLREGMRTYDLLIKACNNFLQIKPKLLGIVRRDTRVRDAIRNQSSVISRYPTSEAAEDVLKIAKRLVYNE